MEYERARQDNGARKLEWLPYLVALLCAIAGSAAMSPATAMAAGSITLFDAGLSPGRSPDAITTGPDGNLWFTDLGGAAGEECLGGLIGKVTPAGAITEYTDGLNPCSSPTVITTGPDSNLWFTDTPGPFEDEEGTPAIGRITPDGVITQFSSGVNQDDEPITLQGPTDIITGPDGNLWFGDSGGFFSDENSSVGKITPSGAITVFELSACTIPTEFVVGPNGNLWFNNEGKGNCGGLGRITMDGVITEFDILDGSFDASETGMPRRLVVGPDDNLWFTGDDAIGRMTPSGTITAFSAGLPAEPSLGTIIVGPDGNLWFTDSPAFTDEAAIGRITPSGEITEFSTTDPERDQLRDLLAGPDGNLWFTFSNESAIGRITTDGLVTNFSEGLANGSDPLDLVAGPSDSDIWFTDLAITREKGAIGRIEPVGPAGVSPKPTLTILTEGNGSVSSNPQGISCDSVCAGEFEAGGVVTLTATPDPGWDFKGWNANEGCLIEPIECFAIQWQEGSSCTGTAACDLTMGGDSKVLAVFVPDDSDESEDADDGGSSPEASDPTPTPPATPPKSTPGLAFLAKAGLVKRGLALVRARCIGDTACRGVANLIKRLRTRRVVRRGNNRRVVRRVKNVLIGRGRFGIAPGRLGIVRLRLTRAGKKLVRRSGRRGLRAKLIGRSLKNRSVTLRTRHRQRRRRQRRSASSASTSRTDAMSPKRLMNGVIWVFDNRTDDFVQAAGTARQYMVSPRKAMLTRGVIRLVSPCPPEEIINDIPIRFQRVTIRPKTQTEVSCGRAPNTNIYTPTQYGDDPYHTRNAFQLYLNRMGSMAAQSAGIGRSGHGRTARINATRSRAVLAYARTHRNRGPKQLKKLTLYKNGTTHRNWYP